MDEFDGGMGLPDDELMGDEPGAADGADGEGEGEPGSAPEPKGGRRSSGGGGGRKASAPPAAKKAKPVKKAAVAKKAAPKKKAPPPD